MSAAAQIDLLPTAPPEPEPVWEDRERPDDAIGVHVRYRHPVQNRRWPGCTDGVHVDVMRRYDGRWQVVGHASRPDETRLQTGRRELAADKQEAIGAALVMATELEAWLALPHDVACYHAALRLSREVGRRRARLARAKGDERLREGDLCVTMRHRDRMLLRAGRGRV